MDIVEEVYSFYEDFAGEKGYFGQAESGRLLPYVRVGRGSPTILLQYCIHAREYITSYLALSQIRDAESAYPGGSLFFAPMVNPDGVEIVLGGEPLYKANGKGVDLNVNFDAKWGTGVNNKRIKGAADYIGEYPFSAAETRALRDFTYFVKPDATVSYHSKGREIYWYFGQEGERAERDFKIAEAVGGVTGYRVTNPSGSAGGYKDWCIENFAIPSLTIEVGDNYLAHPIGKERLPKIAAENAAVIKTLVERLKKSDP